MRAFNSSCLSPLQWAVVVIGVLLPGAGARADHLPLPPAEQADVNHAIDQGVVFLKKAQLRSGSWAAEGNNTVGYAALPGLTLLECGVPVDDPAVQRAASFVRRSVGSMDRTYDLALSLLFLDRLGDPKDEKRIQTLALRLVAGQSPTGGWSYKCPVLAPEESQQLLAVLRRIAPGPSPLPLEGVALTGLPAGGGNLLGQPALNPGPLAGGPALNPGPLAGGPALNGLSLTGKPSLHSSSPGTTSPGDSTPSPGATLNLPADSASAAKGMLALQSREESVGTRGWAWCIKSEEEPPDDSVAAPKPKPKAGTPIIPRPVSIPANLNRLTVFQDFSRLQMLDPKDKTEAVIFSTTDNSNTQFAILALWVAQRHDVPMERTLRLVANRFQTSQNADGSWSYHYAFGGGQPEGAAMDCVGVLGLAVGLGISQAGQGAVNPVQDPTILKGFAALSRHVGVPAGRTHDLPLVNMYMLWSIERVSVLYRLPTIADKDWYRWGAEILVANQAKPGNWLADGGYPGQTPTANTCLALLFLRKANLVGDLTAALPIRPEDLTKAIFDQVAPKDKPADANTRPVAPAPPAAPPEDLDGKLARPTAPPSAGPVAPALAEVPTASPAQTAPDEGGVRWWLVLLLILAALALLAASAAAFILHRRNRDKAEKSSKKVRNKKGAEKRSIGAAATTTKKPGGKSRLHA